MTPIPFCSIRGYRRFCGSWWKQVGRWLMVGWWRDVRVYWHRARYGWAPRDTWSLDHYLARVLAGSLAHLATHNCGAPTGYPKKFSEIARAGGDGALPVVSVDALDATDFKQWDADLARWAQAFEAYTRDDYYEIHGTDYDAWLRDERARSEALHQVLREMEPWFEALWD